MFVPSTDWDTGSSGRFAEVSADRTDDHINSKFPINLKNQLWLVCSGRTWWVLGRSARTWRTVWGIRKRWQVHRRLVNASEVCVWNAPSMRLYWQKRTPAFTSRPSNDSPSEWDTFVGHLMYNESNYACKYTFIAPLKSSDLSGLQMVIAQIDRDSIFIRKMVCFRYVRTFLKLKCMVLPC